MKAPGDGWAYLPEDGRPDRLIRFVTGDPSTDHFLAIPNNETNILYVHRKNFDALDNIDQGRVLATFHGLTAIVRDGKVSIEN
jgi:hypothetical protein